MTALGEHRSIWRAPVLPGLRVMRLDGVARDWRGATDAIAVSVHREGAAEVTLHGTDRAYKFVLHASDTLRRAVGVFGPFAIKLDAVQTRERFVRASHSTSIAHCSFIAATAMARRGSILCALIGTSACAAGPSDASALGEYLDRVFRPQGAR
jgi:hypothetical protein